MIKKISIKQEGWEINPEKETEKIIIFIKRTMEKTGYRKVVLGISGGVDSSTVLALCVRALGEGKVYVVAMPYNEEENEGILMAQKLNLPKGNILKINIKDLVECFKKYLTEDKNLEGRLKSEKINELADKIRWGNMVARVRMIILYDLAKKLKALVCGTENKSEYLLGYYTRFGDEASDLEPIRHLYKTQVYKLARYLGVLKTIINKEPTAGLWRGQTDRKELGFSYRVADRVLFWFFEKKLNWEKIREKIKEEEMKITERTIERIKSRIEENLFKKEVPYKI